MQTGKFSIQNASEVIQDYKQGKLSEEDYAIFRKAYPKLQVNFRELHFDITLPEILLKYVNKP